MVAPLVCLRGIGKRFGELWAVREVDLELARGRIHALLGENGAGKTTLMSILAGLHRPDAGFVELDGQRRELRSPRDAMAAGVGMVHQHFSLVPSLSVTENVLLGAAGLPWLLRPAMLREQVAQSAARYGLHLDPAACTGDLSVGEQQRVEILRVLARGARVLILDEPTAVLAPGEIDALFSSLRHLCDEGCAVVLISHKLEELRRVADRVSIMRAGRLVAAVDDPKSRSVDELAALMVGREVSLRLERPAQSTGDPRLQAHGLRVRTDRDRVCGVSLQVRGGEVVGLAGISGHGQGELLDALAGLRPCTEGEILLEGHDITAASPRRRATLGLRYVPEDRQRTGTAPSLSVRENLLLRSYRQPPTRRGLCLDLHAADEQCQERVRSLQIAATSLDQSARLLSGGNLQKLILVRELGDRARVILCMHPTRGLDAWATAEVQHRLLEARARGCAVLLCSEDLDEVLSLSDRVLVMAAGRIVHEATAERADRLEIGRHMVSA